MRISLKEIGKLKGKQIESTENEVTMGHIEFKLLGDIKLEILKRYS